MPAWKAIVGERVFAHESGLHVDGVLKDPRNYEPFEPGEVGLCRTLMLGKHTGRRGLSERLRRLGLDPDGISLANMLRQVRAVSQQHKRALEDAELIALYRESARSMPLPDLRTKAAQPA
jgi:homocitrate synthase NifV